MPRDLPIGNGNMLVAFDQDYLLRELYFPHVGEESHTMGAPSRFGVMINGEFSWVPDHWQIEKDYLDDTLITYVTLKKGVVEIVAEDFVDFHENIYFKKLTLKNLSQAPLHIKLFFAHDFSIYGNEISDTALYRPEAKALVHYKNQRYFLINSNLGISEYATGNKNRGSFVGTWKDAEDGKLSGNPIAQGSVDSVLSISLQVEPSQQEECFLWIACGKEWAEVQALQEAIQRKGPQAYYGRTLHYWKLWVNKEIFDETRLPPPVLKEYKRSLLILRTQINNCGSIIAANDSDVMHFNRDTYSYMWPRDGAYVAHALDLAGYGSTTIDFYKMCAKIIEKEGYFLHKYNPSGTVASSWHPWLVDKKGELPIQEDETALVIWALWEHYTLFRDIEFIKPLYRSLIKRGADFIMRYQDKATGLPLPSYDLWEERRGVLTYTCSTVYGALIAASNFTEAFGEMAISAEYRERALSLRKAMDRYLFLEKEGRFARGVRFREDGSYEVDATIDSSLYALFAFGAYSPSDPKVKSTMDQVIDKLSVSGGFARYEDDPYYRDCKVTGNPWFVTTLWIGEYYVAIGDKESALKILLWVAEHALKSGVLAEQVHPKTHEPLSVSPLSWSHAMYITLVQKYLRKF